MGYNQVISSFVFTSRIPNRLNTGTRVVTEATDIANEFNAFFCPTPDHSQSTLNHSHTVNTQSTQSIHNQTPYSFYLYPTSPNEVSNAITSLRTTGPGLDDLQPSKIKLISPHIVEVLAHIINCMFKTGVFPNELKHGKITPVFKKGDKELVSNYRPICILPFFSKIIEKLLVNRLTNYFQKFNLLSPEQHGFRRNYSTETAILSFTDKIKHALDSGHIVGSVFVDFSKAFDTISHDILSHKLEAVGIRGPALSLIGSYLTNRTQIVNFEGSLSHVKPVIMGVPQGSLLGPILFLVYINDLPNCLTSTSSILYADDTTIFTSSDCMSTIITRLNCDLSNLSAWCNKNKLRINASKTQFMLFHTNKRVIPSAPSLILNDHILSPTHEVIFLGIKLDRHLKFNLHAEMISKKIAFGIRVLILTRSFFPQHIRTSLYYAFIHSHLQYCISVWGNTYSTHLTHLQHLQNQALRIINFSSYMSHSVLNYTSLSILPLRYMVQLKLVLLIYRTLNYEIAIDTFQASALTNSNNTRFSSNSNILLPRINTNYGKFTALFTAIQYWNILPLDIKACRTTILFKKHMKSHLLTTLLAIDSL